MNFCDAFDIPVLTLTNVTGFAATTCSEKRMAKAAGRLTYAFANATVPKVNVIIGKAYGSAYVAMNSKAVGAEIIDVRTSVVGHTLYEFRSSCDYGPCDHYPQHKKQQA